MEVDEEDQRFFEKDVEKEHKRIIMRHRLDFAKMLFKNDSVQNIRQFKEIFLKEIKEHPDLYFL